MEKKQREGTDRQWRRISYNASITFCVMKNSDGNSDGQEWSPWEKEEGNGRDGRPFDAVILNV